jgi:hypothetical protein
MNDRKMSDRKNSLFGKDAVGVLPNVAARDVPVEFCDGVSNRRDQGEVSTTPQIATP